MTLAELEDRLSIEEYMEWMILESIEPFGERAAYLRAGLSFDFEKGIGQAPKQTLAGKQGLAGRKELKFEGAEEMNKAMQGLMKEFPGAIRMRPKPN